MFWFHTDFSTKTPYDFNQLLDSKLNFYFKTRSFAIFSMSFDIKPCVIVLSYYNKAAFTRATFLRRNSKIFSAKNFLVEWLLTRNETR